MHHLDKRTHNKYCQKMLICYIDRWDFIELFTIKKNDQEI